MRGIILSIALFCMGSIGLLSAPFIYVANQDKGTFSVIDMDDSSTQARSRSLSLSSYGEIRCLALSPDGRYAYLGVCSNNPQLLVVDLSSLSIEKTRRLSGIPTAIAIAPNGSMAYICIRDLYSKKRKKIVKKEPFSNGAVAVVDLHHLKKNPAIIPVGAMPSAIAISQDGAKGYVCNFGSNSVSILDLKSKKQEAVISVQAPSVILLVPDVPVAYVFNSVTNTLVEIDLLKKSVLRESALVPSFQPISLATPLGSGNIYTIFSGQKDLIAIDQIRQTIQQTVDIGQGAEALALTPDGTTACIAKTSGSIVCIDLKTNKVTKTFSALAGRNLIAVGGIFGPRKCLGKVKWSRTNKRLSMKLSWKKSKAPSVVEYQIFSLHYKIASVPPTQKSYTVLLSPLAGERTSRPYLLMLGSDYKIRAVDAKGHVSGFVQLTVSRS